MLKGILEFFQQSLAPQGVAPEAHTERRLQLATAALMLEMTKVDGEVSESECTAMHRALAEQFELGDEAISRLIALAEAEARDSTGDYAFTSLINKAYTPEEKLRVFEYMWRIAYADGHVDAHEHHFIRKLADLLYISRADYAEAKRRARES